MAADRGISPQLARRLAHELEQAAHRIEHDRRAAVHALAAVGWPAPSELAALAGVTHRLHGSAHDVRARAHRIEHQKVRAFACFHPPRRHSSNPVFSFVKGVWSGVSATAKGAVHLAAATATTPVHMIGAARQGVPPDVYLARKAINTIHAFWESRTTFWHASAISLVVETQRHGVGRAVDEWAYANGAITPFVVTTVATMGTGSSALLAQGLVRAGMSEGAAATTSTAIGLATTSPPPAITPAERRASATADPPSCPSTRAGRAISRGASRPDR
jgi:hypothetical protein